MTSKQQSRLNIINVLFVFIAFTVSSAYLRTTTTVKVKILHKQEGFARKSVITGQYYNSVNNNVHYFCSQYCHHSQKYKYQQKIDDLSTIYLEKSIKSCVCVGTTLAVDCKMLYNHPLSTLGPLTDCFQSFIIPAHCMCWI